MNRIIAVCAARAEDLRDLMERGRRLADQLQATLVLLLTQRPGQTPGDDLEAAMQLARCYDAELRVHYTENICQTIQDYLDEWLPMTVMTQQNDLEEREPLRQYALAQ